ncbi:MAG: HNH endonuclease [Stenomitos frigidus ULC029]
MQNLVFTRRNSLSQENYVRKAAPGNSYWFDFSESKLNEYIVKFSENFNLIIFGNELQEGDFYVIPFKYVKSALTAASLTKGENGSNKRRWIGSIDGNRFRIRNYQGYFDIGDFYGNPELIGLFQSQEVAKSTEKASKTPHDLGRIKKEEENEYAIHNRQAEIKIRQKQSLFRKKVLSNFEGKCYLCGIAETDLLVASHIIPWSHQVKSRLDPANGFCLFTLYDQLFDEGYITFRYSRYREEIQVFITPFYKFLSLELRDILEKLEGKNIRKPVKYQIKFEYLEHHYNTIFLEKVKHIESSLKINHPSP